MTWDPQWFWDFLHKLVIFDASLWGNCLVLFLISDFTYIFFFLFGFFFRDMAQLRPQASAQSHLHAARLKRCQMSKHFSENKIIESYLEESRPFVKRVWNSSLEMFPNAGGHTASNLTSDLHRVTVSSLRFNLSKCLTAR